jgi:hypothetical protein
MTTIERSIVIDRPVEEVWEFVHDTADNILWQTTLAESEKLTEGPMDVGTRVREVRHFLGLRIESTWEMTEYEPNRTSAIRGASGPIPAQRPLSRRGVRRRDEVHRDRRARRARLLQAGRARLRPHRRKGARGKPRPPQRSARSPVTGGRADERRAGPHHCLTGAAPAASASLAGDRGVADDDSGGTPLRGDQSAQASARVSRRVGRAPKRPADTGVLPRTPRAPKRPSNAARQAERAFWPGSQNAR